jgi:hypothetical protein
MLEVYRAWSRDRVVYARAWCEGGRAYGTHTALRTPYVDT